MPYHSLNAELKKRFGGKTYKLALDIGCTCPNRDGTLAYGGCIFCAEGGAGFASKETDDHADIDINAMIDAAKLLVASKMKSANNASGGSGDEGRYIAYFQSFTNTYGDIEKIGGYFRTAIERPDICAISVATRPDCLQEEWVELLSELNKIKPVWVELGLQTIHERTAEIINRGYPLSVFEDTYSRLKAAGLEVIVHVILGLPGETKKDMTETVEYLASLDPVLDGIKLQLMHVLKGTRLAEMYELDNSTIYPFEMEEYVEFVCSLVEKLPPETVVHRLTGDGSKRLLIAPMWSANKKAVLNAFNRKLH